MVKRNVISSPDDIAAHFLESLVLKSSYNNLVFKYSINKNFGKGYMERIILCEDVEMWIINILLYRDEYLCYDMPSDLFEISCCIKGKCTNYIQDEKIKVDIASGTVSLFAKKNIIGRAYYPKNVNCQSISIMTNKDYVINLVNKYSNGKKCSWNQLDREKISELCLGKQVTGAETRLIKEIITCKIQKEARLMYLYAKAHEFIALKLNEIINIPSQSQMDNTSLNDYIYERLEMAKGILIANMSKPPSIEELSKRIGINPTKLKKDFKAAYNTTIYGFLREKRLEYSKKILYNRELTIAEIANEVGYSNPSKFAKAFRQKYGLNPKEIRQNYINL